MKVYETKEYSFSLGTIHEYHHIDLVEFHNGDTFIDKFVEDVAHKIDKLHYDTFEEIGLSKEILSRLSREGRLSCVVYNDGIDYYLDNVELLRVRISTVTDEGYIINSHVVITKIASSELVKGLLSR